MRKVGVVLVLFLGALLALWQIADDEAPARRDAALAEAPPAASSPRSTLRIEDGVARAPDFDKPALRGAATAPVRHTWVGRAVSASTKTGAGGATVRLRQLDPPAEWDQPPTEPGGRFHVVAPPEATGELTLSIVSPANESALMGLAVGEDDITDLGEVRLTGHATLEGRVENDDGTPVEEAIINVRRYGRLALLPGVLAHAATDEHGRFALARLPHGLFAVRGVDPIGRRYLKTPVPVPLREELVLRARTAYRLDVAVETKLDEPVVDAVVEIVPRGVDPNRDPFADGLALDPRADRTGSKGRLRFEYVLPGRYWLLVTLPDGSRFEFRHLHARHAERILRVPADPGVHLRFYLAPPHRPRAWLEQRTKVTLEVTGKSSVPERDFEGPLTVTTDANGFAVIPRLGPVSMGIEAFAKKLARGGFASIRWERFPPGVVHAVPLEPIEPEPTLEDVVVTAHDAPTPPERRAVVRTPEGLPVKGAVVYVRKRHETNEEGVAALGPQIDDARCHLSRPDLASGDPSSEKFGGASTADLVWPTGREVVLKVTDARDGYILDRGVRITPRPSAWERVEPGVFRSRWDPAADPELAITVAVKGYQPWIGRPPQVDGDPMAYDAALDPASGANETILLLETVARGRPFAGALVSGEWSEGAGGGTTNFRALTGPDGLVEVPELAAGHWLFTADAGPAGWVETSNLLAPGVNEISIVLHNGPLLRGVVFADRRKRLAGVRIERLVTPRQPWREKWNPPVTYTDKQGRFGLNIGPLGPTRVSFRAHKPGYQDVTFLVGQPRETKLLRIVMPRLATIEYPVRWADRRAAPIPRDLEMRVRLVTDPKRWNGWKDTGVTARMRNGRLVATGVPPGLLWFTHHRGSAVAKSFKIEVGPGQRSRKGMVVLTPGGTLRGRVLRDGQPVPGVIVHVTRKGVSEPVRTGPDGRFLRDGFAPGVYVVRHPRQTTESARINSKVKLDEGFVTNAVVELLP